MSWGAILVVLTASALCSVFYFVGMGAGYQNGAEDGYQAGFAVAKALICEGVVK